MLWQKIKGGLHRLFYSPLKLSNGQPMLRLAAVVCIIVFKQFCLAFNNILLGVITSKTDIDSVLIAVCRVLLAASGLFVLGKLNGLSFEIPKQDVKVVRWFGFVVLPIGILTYIMGLRYTSRMYLSMMTLCRSNQRQYTRHSDACVHSGTDVGNRKRAVLIY